MSLPGRTARSFLSSCSLLLLAGFLSNQAFAADQPENSLDLEAIEAAGATIGKITINSHNIFDLSNPLDDKWLFRWANRLHVVTQPEVIESQLLFDEGDVFNLRLAEESERILRRNAYLKEAEVKPINFENGIVDLEIETQDVWTLVPEISISRSGGENSFGVGMIEHNLLGRGIQLGAAWKSDVDRDTLFFEYTDNNFLLERYRFSVNYANNSDGFLHRFDFGRPFYALDTRQAGHVFYSNIEQIDQLYDRSDVVAEYEHRFQYHDAFVGWSSGLRNGWTRRYRIGIAYDNHRFDMTDDLTLPITIIPENREHLYPYVGVEFVEDRFEETANFDQIHITEDRFVGRWFHFRLGYSDKSSGSSSNAWHYSGGYNHTFVNSNRTSLTLDSRVHGRYESSELQNAELFGRLRFHRRLRGNHLFYTALSGTAGKNLDVDNPLYLGGDTGLRGYPLRYQNGESNALFTAEYRIYTDYYLFRLFHVGAAAFFDAGRVWGESPVNAPNLGILKDVGVGLRLGNTRSSSSSVIHIDIAFPLDGEDDIDDVQILFKARGSF